MTLSIFRMSYEAKIIPFPTETPEKPAHSPFERGQSDELVNLESVRIRKKLSHLLFFTEHEASSTEAKNSNTLGARGRIILRNLEKTLLQPGSLKLLKEELKGNHNRITALKTLIQKAIASGLVTNDTVKKLSTAAR